MRSLLERSLAQTPERIVRVTKKKYLLLRHTQGCEPRAALRLATLSIDATIEVACRDNDDRNRFVTLDRFQDEAAGDEG